MHPIWRAYFSKGLVKNPPTKKIPCPKWLPIETLSHGKSIEIRAFQGATLDFTVSDLNLIDLDLDAGGEPKGRQYCKSCADFT